MPYKLIKNQFGGADICQILILIAVVVVVYYLFVQSQPAVVTEPKKVEKYSAHYDIAVSEPAFTSEENYNKKTRPAVDVKYTGVPYYHIPSVLTSENTYATPEDTEKNEAKARAAVARTYKKERTQDLKDEVRGRKKMDHDFGIVVENPRVYRNFVSSPVVYSPPFDTTSVQSVLNTTTPLSQTSGRSVSASSTSQSVVSSSERQTVGSGTTKSRSSRSSGSSDSPSSASYTVSPPEYVSSPPYTGNSPDGKVNDRSSSIGTVTETASSPVVTSSLTIPKSVTITQPTSIASSVVPTTTVSSPGVSSTARPPLTSSDNKQVIEKFTDVNKLYDVQDGYDLKTPLSKSLCSQKCCGYYWKENMGDLFKKNDTVGWADVGVGKKYRTSNVTCMGDGVAPPGCRCYTGDQTELLGTRGGNSSKKY